MIFYPNFYSGHWLFNTSILALLFDVNMCLLFGFNMMYIVDDFLPVNDGKQKLQS